MQFVGGGSYKTSNCPCPRPEHICLCLHSSCRWVKLKNLLSSLPSFRTYLSLLTQRCLGFQSQNANKSLNATVWRLFPKHLNSELQFVEISQRIAAGIINEGYTSFFQCYRQFKYCCCHLCQSVCRNSDEARVKIHNRRRLFQTKKQLVQPKNSCNSQKTSFLRNPMAVISEML